ncbi:hypothetical protein LQ327_18945 [Actinomycetospora endophytica]|uniref:SPW repeat-containing protein n=1 Tax=Actinomycetospora endophytica TaxID=2291215 RepID=A0ABS8PB15_9PSEU|nr:hypothetical protein [Actinomycetospora endophytica]MCD2195452.1 hypothetical protein [Actinomycetospora endophytica]
MALTSRFAIDTTALIAGAFLSTAVFAFAAPVSTWIAFGIFIGLIALGGLGVILDHHATGYLTHGLLAAVGIWSLVATLVFTGATLSWLIVAGAVAAVVLGVADLVAHEVTTERVVHQLEVTPTPEAASV